MTTLGLTLSNITPELKEKFSLKDDKGVVVIEVAEGSPAAEKGLEARRRDRGGRAGGDQERRPGRRARSTKPRRPAARSILLLVDRQGDLRFVALRLDQG